MSGRLTAACPYQHELHRNKSIQRESNPHFRHGEPAGFRYIMDANVLIGLSKNHIESTGWDSNPRCRITGAESSPLNDQCLISQWDQRGSNSHLPG